ncbi:MAG: UDP-glucose 4-epimerase GalE [Burkholderiales bacterium]|nr:UDP-glucose 4-epimerase GalE [Burkholderiales bacterium]
MTQRLLITGGLGFIGSHTCLSLIEAGFDLVILDNLHNCKRSVLDRLQSLAGRTIPFHELDVRDANGLELLFTQYNFDSVMHFAGLKAVGESVADPLSYFDNNVHGSVTLLQAMARHHVKSFVFSSSCTVYGEPATVPIREHFPLQATNPYGRSKLMVEDILRDLAKSDPDWRIAILRYFNPVGAHPSGMLGEDPNGVPNNLLPYVAQVAIGDRQELAVFGGDYPTIDGTGVRDYIHVCDLAEGHVAAQQYIGVHPGTLTVGLGTGQGYSVLQVVEAFKRASGRPIPYRIVPRRPGDVPEVYADPALAREKLGWSTRRGIDEICADAWRWQKWAAGKAL